MQYKQVQIFGSNIHNSHQLRTHKTHTGYAVISVLRSLTLSAEHLKPGTLAHLVELAGVIVLHDRPAVRDVTTVVLGEV